MSVVICIVLAYLLGSVSNAVIVSRVFGLPDPRAAGSGNPGATNVLRLGGKAAAALTLVGDLLKGYLPVVLTRALGFGEDVQAAVALAAFLGHLYPVFLGFRGGKGVATSLGVLLALAWPVGLLALITWLAIAAGWRISSLAALCAAALTPFYTLWLAPRPSFLAVVIVICGLLIWRHRGNIRRLLNGAEGRMGER